MHVPLHKNSESEAADSPPMIYSLVKNSDPAPTNNKSHLMNKKNKIKQIMEKRQRGKLRVSEMIFVNHIIQDK